MKVKSPPSISAVSKKQLLSMLLGLNSILGCSPILAQGEPTANASAADAETSRLLQGGVRHKEYLDPVPSALMAGAKFDEETMPKLTPINNWIPVPAWLAGTWQFKSENVTAMEDYTGADYKKPPYTIRNEGQKIFGQQKDKSGQIWHYLNAPYSYVAKLDHGRLGYERVTRLLVTVSSDYSALALKLTGTDTQVKNQRVTFTSQSEQFSRYTQAGKDAIRLDGSARYFDMQGKATGQQTSYMMPQLSKPFEVIDEQDGKNLKQSFVDFLKSHGKADLVPQ
jgi:hypothetical protein